MLSLESLWLEAKPGGGQVQGKSQAWFSKRNNSKKQYLLGVGSSHPATYLGISLLCVASKAPGIVSKILWSTLWSCCLCMCGELPPQINLSRSILRMCTKHPIFLHYVSLYNYNYIYIYYIIPVGVCFFVHQCNAPKSPRIHDQLSSTGCSGGAKAKQAVLPPAHFCRATSISLKSLSLGSIPSTFLETNSLHLKNGVWKFIFAFWDGNSSGFWCDTSLLFQQCRRYMNMCSPGAKKNTFLKSIDSID